MILVDLATEDGERQPLKQLRTLLHLLFPVGEDVDSSTLRQVDSGDQVLERGTIVRHQTVNDAPPVMKRQ